jgi:hypothetical protein
VEQTIKATTTKTPTKNREQLEEEEVSKSKFGADYEDPFVSETI